MNMDDREGFRRQVSLMDSLPDATQPDYAEVQDDLAALSRPRHPRALEPLREDNLGSVRDACDNS